MGLNLPFDPWEEVKLLRGGKGGTFRQLNCYPGEFWEDIKALLESPKTQVPGTTPETDKFNVRMFGAEGDGVTIDSDAIDDAIEAAIANGGGEVYFPAGNYLVDRTVFVQLSSITINGAGVGISVITADSAIVAPNPVVAVGVTPPATAVINWTGISNLTVDGNGNAQYGVFMYNVRDSRFHDLEITGCTVMGFDGTSSQEVSVTGNNQRNIFYNIYSYLNTGGGISLRGQRESQAFNLMARQNTGNGIEIRPYHMDGDHQVASVHSNYSNFISQGNGGHGFIFDAAQRMSMKGLVSENNTGLALQLTTSFILNLPNTPTGTNSVQFSDVVLRACDQGYVQQTGPSGGSGSQVLRTFWDNVYIEANAGDAAGTSHAFHFYGARHVRLSNVHINVVQADGVRLEDGYIVESGVVTAQPCEDIQLSNVRFQGGRNVSVHLFGGAKDIRLSNCSFGGGNTIGSVNIELDSGYTGSEVTLDGVYMNVSPNRTAFVIPAGMENVISTGILQVDDGTSVNWGARWMQTAALAANTLTIPPNNGSVLMPSIGTVNDIAPMVDTTTVRVFTVAGASTTFAHSVGAAGTGRMLFASGANLTTTVARVVTFTCYGGDWYSSDT